eukprot:CAMPEP_0204348948 /NCGR_PEP_ID=MMETSP0469-20131031/29124_1 /ASSEMBLY_ACC=CAM_ASM_000384 /TAXON_ID=2969 /ORGANISM="Oxyrrhis marina" /LENGTH=46 /DNA_ID= /DNA_START= /DNA_END= /DNA_ORIENTATION=
MATSTGGTPLSHPGCCAAHARCTCHAVLCAERAPPGGEVPSVPKVA